MPVPGEIPTELLIHSTSSNALYGREMEQRWSSLSRRYECPVLSLSNFSLAIEEISEKCPVVSETPYVLPTNNTQSNLVLSEGESFDYKCIDGYTRMTNVTCIQGYLTAQPLCEPSNDRSRNLSMSMETCSALQGTVRHIRIGLKTAT